MPANLENSVVATFSFQSQRTAMPKKCSNYCSIAILHTSKVMLKILQARLQQYVNYELPYVEAGFRKSRGTRDQTASLTTPKPLWITTNCGKFFRRWKYQTALPISWEICMQIKKQRLELNMEQQTGSKLGKEYIKDVYCHPTYFTYMQSTSCEMPGLMKHKVELRLPGERSITSYMQMTRPLRQKVKRNQRASWWKWKKRVKKLAENLTFRKLRLWHLVPSLHAKQMGKQRKQWQTIYLGSKITADGDCSHKIQRFLLLQRKAVTNLNSILKSRDTTLPTKVHLVKPVVFPVVMDGCESWNIKKAEPRRTDAFELWCWRRLLRVPWTARRSNQSILKELSPEYSLEGLMLKLKL